MRNILFGSIVIMVFASGPASAKWGCRALDGVMAQGRSWADSSSVARQEALTGCKMAGGRHCKITACDPNMDTREQAHALWPDLPNPAARRE